MNTSQNLIQRLPTELSVFPPVPSNRSNTCYSRGRNDATRWQTFWTITATTGSG